LVEELSREKLFQLLLKDDARDLGLCATISFKRELIDYKTSMITDLDPLRGLLFY